MIATPTTSNGTAVAERIKRRERLQQVDVPTDIRENTLFDWVPVERMFVAPYGRPFSQRKVDGLRTNFDFAAIGVLYLSFRHAEDNYAILDGQHRMVAAKQEGHTELPARIYIDLSYEQEATLYVRFATVNRQTALDRFRARVESRDLLALEIAAVIRDQAGMEISPNGGDFAAIFTAERIVQQHGLPALMETCRILFAVWNNHAKAYSAEMMNGMAQFLVRYGKNPQLKYARLVSVLQSVTPETLSARAHMVAATHGRVSSAYGLAMLTIYNDGLRSGRLPPWAAVVFGEEGKEAARQSMAKANEVLKTKRAATKAMSDR